MRKIILVLPVIAMLVFAVVAYERGLFLVHKNNQVAVQSIKAKGTSTTTPAPTPPPAPAPAPKPKAVSPPTPAPEPAPAPAFSADSTQYPGTGRITLPTANLPSGLTTGWTATLTYSCSPDDSMVLYARFGSTTLGGPTTPGSGTKSLNNVKGDEVVFSVVVPPAGCTWSLVAN